MNNSLIANALQPLVADIGAVIQQARGVLVQQVNAAMVQSYWQIGRLIVEHEQQGQTRAAYGQQQLQYLSEQLTATFGKGFDTSNLRNMRQFFLAFPICDTVCRELAWLCTRQFFSEFCKLLIYRAVSKCDSQKINGLRGFKIFVVYRVGLVKNRCNSCAIPQKSKNEFAGILGLKS